MLLIISVAWAGLNAAKVEKFVDQGKADKGWALCKEAMETGGIPASAMDACGAAAYALIKPTSGDKPTADQLDEFVVKWGTTASGIQAKQLAAKQRLSEAGERVDKLAEVYTKYPDTQGGTQALDKAWTITQSIGTAGGWRQYARYFPTSPRQKEAVDNELAFAFTEAEQMNTATGWKYLLDTWPMHPRRVEAEQKVKDLAYNEAVTAGPNALLVWAEKNPTDPRAEGVKATALTGMLRLVVVGVSGEQREVVDGGVLLPGEDALKAYAPNGAQVRLELEDAAGATTIATLALPKALRDAGMPADKLPDGSVLTTPHSDGTISVTLPSMFCQPAAGDWMLHVSTRDTDRAWKIVPPDTCIAIVDGTVPEPAKKRR